MNSNIPVDTFFTEEIIVLITGYPLNIIFQRNTKFPNGFPCASKFKVHIEYFISLGIKSKASFCDYYLLDYSINRSKLVP